MLEAYCDESFDQGSPKRVFAVAGWFGEAAAWRRLESDWDAVLRCTRPRVHEFKTQDCFNGNRAFDGWTVQRRMALVARLVRVLLQHDIKGVVCAMSVTGQAISGYDYENCLRFTVGGLTELALNYARGERVAYIIDERPKFHRYVEYERKQLRGRITSSNVAFRRLAERVGPMAVDNSRYVIPLQAADLLAYMTYRAGRHLVDKGMAYTRVELNSVVEKIAYQQFLDFDATKEVLRALRPTPKFPRGRWVKLPAYPTGGAA